MTERVLIVHNAYQQRGGEDAVVAAEMALLRRWGHEVELFERHNDDIAHISRVRLVLDTVWSAESGKALVELTRRFRPHIVHVHNTWPLISPSIYWAASQAGLPVVQTLHNFRLLCPQAMFLREGRVCEDCLGKVPWRGAMRGCYRGSRAQSSALASMITAHRMLGTYKEKVARYIALTEFTRKKFIEGGLPAERIVVKPNFVDSPPPVNAERSGFIFVGRLAAEKGVDVLACAARLTPQALVRIAGTGSESLALAGIGNVQLLGALDATEVQDEMARAIALVLPSICYENFPRTLVEAYAAGLPVIASRIGALAELVDDGVTGLLFEPGNASDLAAKMQWAHAHPERVADMGRRARICYGAKYTPERNYGQLMAIYAAAIAELRHKDIVA